MLLVVGATPWRVTEYNVLLHSIQHLHVVAAEDLALYDASSVRVGLLGVAPHTRWFYLGTNTSDIGVVLQHLCSLARVLDGVAKLKVLGKANDVATNTGAAVRDLGTGEGQSISLAQ